MNLPFSSPSTGPSEPSSAYDARPMVAIRRQDRSARWFAGGAIIAAVMLFSALESRRRGVEQAGTQSATTYFAQPETFPELVEPALPPELTPSDAGNWPQPGDAQKRAAAPIAVAQPHPSAGRPDFEPPSYVDNPYQAPPPSPPMLNGQSAADGSSAPGYDSLPAPAGASVGGANRIKAGRLENPSATVVQGTLINAVLETALDSTRPGQTRAVVTRDIYGFDGARLLIPRGTRLYGVYESDVAQGQKRAQIRWTRLLRPDGVSVALDSPAADPLGRAGIGGKVNNHFFERLGNALVGTTANVGSALVTRSIASPSPVVVAVPGATQTASQIVTPSSNQITPTLTVRQGSRIAVFVQHDLDFTSVEQAP